MTLYVSPLQMNTMSQKSVRFISTADFNPEEWNLISRSSHKSALLNNQRKQPYSHLLLRFDSKTKLIYAGIGLMEESIPTAEGKTINVLRLGVPFGDVGAENLGVLFSHLIRYSFKAWRKSGFRALYWWTAADHELYGIIARFSMRFYPSRKYLMLSSISWLQERLGRKHFGEFYHSHTGTIAELAHAGTAIHTASPQPANWLDHISDVSWNDPDYGYYLDINSGVVKGNTLLVLMPFNLANLAVMQLKISMSRIGASWQLKMQNTRVGLARLFTGIWKNAAPIKGILREE